MNFLTQSLLSVLSFSLVPFFYFSSLKGLLGALKSSVFLFIMFIFSSVILNMLNLFLIDVLITVSVNFTLCEIPGTV